MVDDKTQNDGWLPAWVSGLWAASFSYSMKDAPGTWEAARSLQPVPCFQWGQKVQLWGFSVQHKEHTVCWFKEYPGLMSPRR